jgi:hypothetical protein
MTPPLDIGAMPVHTVVCIRAIVLLWRHWDELLAYFSIVAVDREIRSLSCEMTRSMVTDAKATTSNSYALNQYSGVLPVARRII